MIVVFKSVEDLQMMDTILIKCQAPDGGFWFQLFAVVKI